jgi:hypothetical protein
MSDNCIWLFRISSGPDRSRAYPEAGSIALAAKNRIGPDPTGMSGPYFQRLRLMPGLSNL